MAEEENRDELLLEVSEKLDSVIEATTPGSQRNARSVDVETPVKETDQNFYLADGRVVPKSVVEALDNFDNVWPGATLPAARAAVAHRVIQAWEKRKKEISAQATLFPINREEARRNARRGQ